MGEDFDVDNFVAEDFVGRRAVEDVVETCVRDEVWEMVLFNGRDMKGWE